MPDINEPLLRAAARYILDHPEKLDMNEGLVMFNECGTTACIAGTVCLLFVQPDETELYDANLYDQCKPFLESQPKGWISSRERYIELFAQEYQKVKDSVASVPDGLEIKSELSCEDRRINWDTLQALACSLLGLTKEESCILFFLQDEDERERMPKELRSLHDRYLKAKRDTTRAKLVSQFIEAYIPYIRRSREEAEAH